jgi:5'-deoxynucleotidase YfbR-like HD superfamily hydrolase
MAKNNGEAIMTPENGGISGMYKRPDGNVEKLGFLREVADVKRSHTNFAHIQDTLARHKYNMLNLLFELKPEVSMNLVKAVMWHDAAERHTGDVPSPIKKRFPRLKEALDEAEQAIEATYSLKVDITPDDKLWLKAVDKLEYLLTSIEDYELGNSRAGVQIEKYRNHIQNAADIPKAVKLAADNYRMRRSTGVENVR